MRPKPFFTIAKGYKIPATQLSKLNTFRTGSIPVLTHALVTENHIIAYALDHPPCHIPVWYRIKHGWEVPKPVLTPIEVLCKIAKKQEIKSLVHEDNKIVIKTKAGNFSTPAIPVEEFPEAAFPEYKNSGQQINTNRLKRIDTYASVDDLRPAMCGVLFSEKFVATNGHRLIWEPAPVIEGVQQHIIPSEAIRLLTSEKYELQKVDDQRFAFVGESDAVVYDAIAEQFPNWESIVPDVNRAVQKISVRKQDLLTSLTACEPMISTSVVFTPKDGKVYIRAEDLDMSQEYESPPFGVVEAEEPHRIQFNRNLILNSLSELPEQIIIHTFGANRGAVFNEKMVIMPFAT